MSENLKDVEDVEIKSVELRKNKNGIYVPELDRDYYDDPSRWFLDLRKVNDMAGNLVEVRGLSSRSIINGANRHYGHFLINVTDITGSVVVTHGKGPYGLTESKESSFDITGVGDFLTDFEGGEFTEAITSFEDDFEEKSWAFARHIERCLLGLEIDPNYVELEDRLFEYFKHEDLDDRQKKLLRSIVNLALESSHGDLDIAEYALWTPSDALDDPSLSPLEAIDLSTNFTGVDGGTDMRHGSLGLAMMGAVNGLFKLRRRVPVMSEVESIRARFEDPLEWMKTRRRLTYRELQSGDMLSSPAHQVEWRSPQDKREVIGVIAKMHEEGKLKVKTAVNFQLYQGGAASVPIENYLSGDQPQSNLDAFELRAKSPTIVYLWDEAGILIAKLEISQDKHGEYTKKISFLQDDEPVGICTNLLEALDQELMQESRTEYI